MVSRKIKGVRLDNATAVKQAAVSENFVSKSGFKEGDVIVDAQDAKRVGTVCSIINEGLDYMVRFADADTCLPMTHSSLAIAPPGTNGPQCMADC
jgi:hypothetical protein